MAVTRFGASMSAMPPIVDLDHPCSLKYTLAGY